MVRTRRLRSDGEAVMSHRAEKQQKIDTYIVISYLYNKALTNIN